MLLVEPNEALRASLLQWWKCWGLQCDQVDDLAAANVLAGKHRYDLILVERGILTDAFESEFKRLTASQRTATEGKSPICLLSNRRLPAADLWQMGVQGLVVKPIRPASLLDNILRAMELGETHEPALSVAAPIDSTLGERLPMSLLVADDNPINQKVALKLLERLGYEATVVSNGRETLEALDAKRFDAILLDVQMPVMDGYEAAGRIRSAWKDRETARPRLIAMTGNAMRGDREKCLQAGMDEYLSKPVRINELQEILERLGRQRWQGDAP